MLHAANTKSTTGSTSMKIGTSLLTTRQARVTPTAAAQTAVPTATAPTARLKRHVASTICRLRSSTSALVPRQAYNGGMESRDPSDPRQVVLDHIESLHAKVEELEGELCEARENLNQFARTVSHLERNNLELRAEVDLQKKMRRTEREGLAAWLDRRIEQQMEAVRPSYISHETKRVLEIEISLLRRYRDMVVEEGVRGPTEDPLMQKFV